MAQTMLLVPIVSTHTIDLKRDSLLQLQIQKLKPQLLSSQLFLSPLLSLSSSYVVKTYAMFKSEEMATPKKVEKPKLKVEDGIFGTSGSSEYTKENHELFLGHFAIFGFVAKKNSKLMKLLAPPIMALVIALFPLSYTPASLGIDVPRATSLFRRACIGCHDAGGNLIQPGATLFDKDLQKNGVDNEEEIFRVTYYGKGRMPGFGENCKPKGQCTFGPRLQEEEIRLLAQFVKLQADQGWPSVDFGD